MDNNNSNSGIPGQQTPAGDTPTPGGDAGIGNPTPAGDTPTNSPETPGTTDPNNSSTI